jgi:hypothetical protein
METGYGGPKFSHKLGNVIAEGYGEKACQQKVMAFGASSLTFSLSLSHSLSLSLCLSVCLSVSPFIFSEEDMRKKLCPNLELNL